MDQKGKSFPFLCAAEAEGADGQAAQQSVPWSMSAPFALMAWSPGLRRPRRQATHTARWWRRRALDAGSSAAWSKKKNKCKIVSSGNTARGRPWVSGCFCIVADVYSRENQSGLLFSDDSHACCARYTTLFVSCHENHVNMWV